MDTKICSRSDCHLAGQPQPVSAFGKKRAAQDGLNYQCLECDKTGRRRYYVANQDRVLKRTAALRRGGRDPEKPWPSGWISYDGAHSRVYATFGPARNHVCVDCGQRADHWSYDHADPDEFVGPRTMHDGRVIEIAYSGDPHHYQPRCKSDHIKFDRHRELVAA